MSKRAGPKKEKEYKYITRTFTFEHLQYVVRGKTVKEAEAKLENLRTRLKNGEDVPQHRKDRHGKNYVVDSNGNGIILGPNTLVKDFIPLWLERNIGLFVREPSEAPKGKSMLQDSADMYKSKSKNYVIPVIGNMPIAAVTCMDIDNIFIEAKKKGCSHSTLEKIKICVQRLFKDAFRYHIIESDPSSGLEVPPSSPNCDKMKSHKREPWTERELEVVMQVSYKYDYGKVVRFEHKAGFRNTEIAGLTVADVLFDERVVIVQNPFHLKSNQKSVGKSKRSFRCMGFPISYCDDLRSICEGKSPTDYLFSMVGADGDITNMTEGYMQRRYNEIRREATSILCGTNVIPSANEVAKHKMDEKWMAQYKRLEFYCLRHALSTDMRKAGVPEAVENACLAHDKPSAKVYFHEEISDARKAADTTEEYRTAKYRELYEKILIRPDEFSQNGDPSAA